MDKYNCHPTAKDTPRSVEDIKYCYYEATRLLAEYRDKAENKKSFASASVDTTAIGASNTQTVSEKDNTLNALSTPVESGSATGHYKFNIVYETQRKKQLDLLFSRTCEEENELRRLADELRSVEQQLKKVAVRADLKTKKELANVPYEIKRTLPTGVILRSSLLALPQQKHALSAKLLKKLQLLLDEMGVPARPMPTKPVCETFDKLRQDAVGLLSLRKHLKSKQNEVQALCDRYHALTGNEYKPITTPVLISERPGDAAINDSGSAATVANYLQSGKSSKQSEKSIRVTKRRSSSGPPGLPAKRNKKIPH